MLFIIPQYKKLWIWWLQIIGWGCSSTACFLLNRFTYLIKPCEIAEVDNISSPVENTNFSFDIDIDSDISDEETQEENHISIYRIIKSVYTLNVLAILLSKPLVYIYNNTGSNLDLLVAQFLFEIIPVLIYYFGMFYFGSDHFHYHITLDNSMINNNIIFLSMWCSLVSLVYYSIYHVNNYILFDIYNGIYIFFSISILTTYICVFNTIFCHHKKYLVKLRSKINNNNISINNVIIEIQKFKRELNMSVINFENMFNSISTCGGLGCALIINRMFIINRTKNRLLIKSSLIIYIVLFWIIQIIFYYTASSVFYFQEKISETLNSSHFTETCLKRKNKAVIRNTSTFEKNCILYLDETSTTIDWLVLSKTLTQNFCHFKVLGINIHKWQTFERVIVVLAFIGIMHSSNVKFT